MDTGQHADHGTFPEWENHLDATPLLLQKICLLLGLKLATHLRSVLSLGGPLSPGSAQRRDKPLSSPPATGHVDPRRSDAREHQITPNHPVVNVQQPPSGPVHHHAVAKLVSGRLRTGQSKPPLPLHGAAQESCQHQVHESLGQSLVGRRLRLLADVRKGHPLTFRIFGHRPSSPH